MVRSSSQGVLTLQTFMRMKVTKMNFAMILSIGAVLLRSGIRGQACQECTVIQNETLRIDVAMQQANLVPYVIPTSPLNLLGIRFREVSVDLGNCISPAQTALVPTFTFEDVDPDTYYTLFVGDPDFPSASAPILRFAILSICVNIPGSKFSNQTCGCSGYNIAPYLTAAVPCDSGNHRVVALLMPQTDVIDPTDMKLIEWSSKRVNLDFDEFRSSFGLEDPVAGNFWIASLSCNNCNTCCSS